ncbi:hypothetical protein BGX20_007036 [Mortierella sp. AD010]|nr:hypothetical protein BGX20_007036 [Mortierella sp. AD010]
MNRPTPTRPQTIQNNLPSTRPPRGLYRVQRQDEQSIRSSRSSSSRSSSLFALPSSSSTAPQTSVPTHSHVRHHQNHRHSHPSTEPMEVDHDTAPVHSLTIETLHTTAINPMDFIHGIRTENRLYVGRTNPRGGTSISSSLLPIRPDSEDEYEDSITAIEAPAQGRVAEQESEAGYGQRSATEPHANMQSGMEGRESAGERRPRVSRPSRYPPPEIVADLIQEQLVQGIAEVAANTTSSTDDTSEASPLPPPPALLNSPSTSLETAHSGAIEEGSRDGVTNGSTNETLGNLFARRVHRRRLRSSSLRGLLGFQPVGGVTPREEVVDSALDSGSNPEQHGRQMSSQEAQDQRRYVEGQLPFFARLLVEVGRNIRGGHAQNVEGRTAPGLDRSNPISGLATTDSMTPPEATFTLHSTDNPTPTPELENASPNNTPLSTSSPTSEGNIPSRPRRHTTIRFIQIGGNGSLSAFRSRRPRDGSINSGQTSPQNEQLESPTSLPRDELADAILMFLGNPGSGSASDAESSEAAASDGGETTRSRSRRSPWVVLTLSGAYLNSLLAGSGGDGEELGMSYDELWMLSNLIGPARPITTTQEAIDSAGFHVGQFENAAQGMRGYDVLGDGSKCLVCMSDYEEGEDMRALRCKHGFHQECIDKWLTTGANKCPVCRAAAVVSAE